MADFYAPQFNPPPDILGQYVRGQMAPLQVQQAQQAVTQGGLNIDQMRLALQTRQAMLGAAQRFSQSFDGAPGGTLGAPAGTGAAGAQSPPMGDGGRQDGPQGSVSQPGYDSSNPLGALLDPRRLAAGAQFGALGAMMRGEDPNKPIADALALQTAARQSAIERAKLQAEVPSAGNPMPMFKSFAGMTPEAAASSLTNNPQLFAQWPALAKQYGVDPFDKAKIPLVAAMEYNQRGAPYGLSVDVPHHLRTVQQGLGQSYQVDDATGKITGGASAVPTDKYIVNGQVVERSKAQGVSQGLEPYDSSLLGAEQITPQALEQAFQQTKATGTAPSLAGRDAVAISKISSYIAQRSQQEGLTGQAMAAKQQAFQAQQKVVNDFLDPNGKAGGKLTSINTTVAHANGLLPLIDALGTGNVTKINQARTAYQAQTGNPAPTNYDTLKNLVVGEASNAITANGGDANERAAITAPFDRANSPTALKGAIQTLSTALAGKTEALRNQWDVGTQGTQGSFDKLLLPETRKALGIKGSAHPASIQTLLDKYK